MPRSLKLLALLGTLVLAGACSDPAASISAADTAPAADETCIAGGYLGSGNAAPCKP